MLLNKNQFHDQNSTMHFKWTRIFIQYPKSSYSTLKNNPRVNFSIRVKILLYTGSSRIARVGSLDHTRLRVSR